MMRMVWKDNLFVNDIPKTFEGFMDKVFGYEVDIGFIHFFDFRLYYPENPQDVFALGLHIDEKHFPKHFLFANFQCLRCGLCCKNYEDVEITEETLIMKWEREKRDDILGHMWVNEKGIFHAEIVPVGYLGCPLCRKVKGKPYYYCRIQRSKDYLHVCKAYLCSKSIPVANLNYKDIDELISIIGLSGYYQLIEEDWGEEFDFSSCEIKTHRAMNTC
jgi:hypothetical protein